ncbi:hypothetical protein NW762_006176 [Fusarium torreyae]|uniref:Probable quinone oxidoreductase n=1 Tax=Fusarium torreyae TaxID=1237075 RepID=A0A9W8S3G5_9HYPO|nr:hypothetical protein NW762_006176 [Fusarium torreyae]
MTPLPPNMKAIQIDENGGTEVLCFRDIALPTTGKDQLLVRNEYAGVNYIDTYFRTGLYKTPQLPFTLGREAAGIVVRGSEEFPVGARVVFTGSSGAYAQYSAINASAAVIIPDALPIEQAVASYLQGMSAWTFVREAGEVKHNEWVLVHAAAGGVGLLLVQMLRAVGAKVIATASSEKKMQLAKKNGADYVVHSNTDVVASVKDITNGHGVDVIFDGVGKSTFDADLEMIALKGRLISFGNASGAVDPLNILRLGPKNVKLMRPTLDGYISTRENLERNAAELWELIVSKNLEISIHNTYPLEQAAQAHNDIESRKTSGKLLLKCY